MVVLGSQQQVACGSKQCQQQRVPSAAAFSRPAARRVAALRVQATAAPEAPVSSSAADSVTNYQRPDAAGRYGRFGGKYVPETLIPALAELEVAYQEALADPAFQVGAVFCVQGASASPHWLDWSV